MPLDPQIAGLLSFLAEAGVPPLHEGSPDQARAAFRAMTVDLVKPEDRIQVGEVQVVPVPGGDGDREARLYLPVTGGPWPTTVYFHGGGFVIGDLDTHDQTCRRLCADADTAVLSVDYRLAPEHPFPAAVEDAVAATRWAVERAEELGGKKEVAVAGDSAGGNLAAVAAQHVPGLRGQLLIYPATDAFTHRASRDENGKGYFLELDTMEWFFDHYVPEQVRDEDDSRISPLVRDDLSDQPAAVVVTAEFDPLRDEGEEYAAALMDAGVSVDPVRYDGLIHGFVDMTTASPVAADAVADLNRRFRSLLHG